LRQVRTRHGRRKTGLFLCEGVSCCRELVSQRSAWIEFIVVTADTGGDAAAAAVFRDIETTPAQTYQVPAPQFAEFAATENPQGILCVARQPESDVDASEPMTDPFGLILDRVSDPGNLGTILRTAWAVGLTKVWYTTGTADPFGPKSIRAGMGAQFAVGLRSFTDLDAVHEALPPAGLRGLWTTVPRGGVNCFSDEFDVRDCGLVFGNETHGVTTQANALEVSIPMPGKQADSLNVAQAATVLLFEAVRRGLLEV